MSSSKAIVDVVIVNWNSGAQLRECLQSIAKHDLGACATVVVVDNGSSDNSCVRIDEYGLPLKIIRNSVNLGFGAACNQGAALGKGDFVLFLNPDTRLLSASISHALEFMCSPDAKSVGICGVQLIDENSHISKTCSRFPAIGHFICSALGVDRLRPFFHSGALMVEWDHARTRVVDQVMGAFFFIRRELFEKLEGFDNRFFVYYEEVDLSYRAANAGWKSVYLATANVFHAGGGTSRQIKATRLFYSLRSRILYGLKNFGFLRVGLLLAVTIFIEPMTRFIFSIAGGRLEDAKNTLSAYWRLLVSLPSILILRR